MGIIFYQVPFCHHIKWIIQICLIYSFYVTDGVTQFNNLNPRFIPQMNVLWHHKLWNFILTVHSDHGQYHQQSRIHLTQGLFGRIFTSREEFSTGRYFKISLFTVQGSIEGSQCTVAHRPAEGSPTLVLPYVLMHIFWSRKGLLRNGASWKVMAISSCSSLRQFRSPERALC